jgi:restriction system protein
MKSYYRLMLGKRSAFAAECFEGGFIGVDFQIDEDLSRKFPDDWRSFNKATVPVFLAGHPDKSRVAAGLACGALWTLGKGLAEGDLVLCPDGMGQYRAGEVTGGYYHAPGTHLPHRRRVKWLGQSIARAAMSEALQNSTGSIGTISNITVHGPEIETLLRADAPVLAVIAADPVIEDPVAFAMEKHLEAFLAVNWAQTELGREFTIFEEDGERIGLQYATDAGPIDILAISKDKKRLLVVELKRGRVSDVVVGQALRYMGYVKEQIAEPDQTVEGAIIALEDDKKTRWALAMVPNVSFYRYEIKFKLVKA